MWYLASPSTPAIREAMRAGLLGMIVTPGKAHRLIPGVVWCADNGAFTGRYPGDEAYLSWLADRRSHARQCLFAVAPDVLGDAEATLDRSLSMLGRIRRLGYRAALAAQDGLEHLSVPWSEFDVLFLGGSTAWKLGPAARHLAAQARARGKGVHMGRVNSARRLRYARAIGAASVDGTFLTYGPDQNLPRLLGWVREATTQTVLWEP